MKRNLFIKSVGAIIFAIASATGYTLDVTQITNFGFKWLPLIFFGIFCIVAWIFIDQYGQISKLQDTKPSIKVETTKEGNILYLKVRNNGAEGIFRGQIELTSNDTQVWSLPHYYGYWKYGNEAETNILKGQDDLIQIAEVVSRPNSISEFLNIIFYDEKACYANYISTSSHLIGAKITDENGNTKPLAKNLYKLHVTISASPELKEGVYQRQLSFNIDGWLNR
jgi:hypothetical protein